MTDFDPREVDEVLEEVSQNTISVEGDYELEIFLSTDGKHTVNGRAKTTEGKKKMYTACISLYDRILERYGTKQGQAVKEYKSPPPVQKAVVSQSRASQGQAEVPLCGVHNVPMNWKTGVSKKTGRPYAFWSCGEMNNGMYCDYKVK